MKLLKNLAALAGILFALALPARAVGNSAGAVVLVNSASAKYADFQHYLVPYLGNFGVPYTVLDIASNTVGPNLTNYALIIIGHAQLDTNHLYLDAAGQGNISLAVSNGVGLVNFDNVLATNNAPLYQFEQNIFGLGYTNSASGGTVQFPPTQPLSQMHYITSLHLTNETLALSNASAPTTLTVAGLTLPGGATAVATCGGRPLVVVAQYGQGRAVQWASYDWMSTAIQGPVNGLDDLVWRGFVWAARKPFVMRGMPNLATMRIDDVTGNENTTGPQPPAFWWIHQMTNAGFKPWLGLFTDDITYESVNWPADNRIADLSNLVSSGLVTASMHSFTATQTNFFYFNHATFTAWPDSKMSNNYVLGTQWLQSAGIPSSKVVIAHYGEMGANSFNGLTNWGVEFVMMELVPGTEAYSPPYALWLQAGPYRLYDTPQQAQSLLPFFYADWITVSNHPELNGKLFNCYTEVQNVSPMGEWAPTNGDIPGSIARGYQQLKRGFDSLTLGNIFTHEFHIDQSDGPPYGNFTTNNFAAVLSGITNAVAPYHPIYVTLDYACQYVRATRTSTPVSADYDPATGRISATFNGYTDLPLSVYAWTGADSSITNLVGTLPAFTGTTNVTVGSLPAPVQLLTPVVQNGSNVFTIIGQYNRSYAIESTPSIQSGWTSNLTVVLSNDPVVISLPAGTSNQFYRARLLP
jgi:hypothetical protein